MTFFLQDQGKHLLIKILFGGHIPADLESNTFLPKLVKLSVYLRWVAMSVLSEEYEKLVDLHEEKKRPDRSVLSYLYMAVEDYILSAWVQYLLQFSPDHLSLHFDGVRVSAESLDVSKLCKSSAEYISESTGFKVNVREKQHKTVLEFLEQRACNSTSRELGDRHVYHESGNCIPAAIAALVSSDDGIISALGKECEENRFQQTRGCRSYKQCQTLCNVKLRPCLDISSINSGKYLLHTESSGKPHCVALIVDKGEGDVQVVDVESCFQAPWVAFADSIHSGVDASTAVFFKVLAEADDLAEEESANLEALLDLQAAGKVVNVSSDESREDVVDLLTDSDCDDQDMGADWLDEEGNVTVDSNLVEDLRQEVMDLAKDCAGRKLRKSAAGFRCLACPWRSFQSPSRVADHLKKYHKASKQYCCSGTKQLKIILSLHDSDMISGQKQGKYLQRSAALLAEQVAPPLPRTVNQIDRHIRLLLDISGPRFVHLQSLEKDIAAKCQGNIWYTHAFAEKVYQEIMIHHAKAWRCLLVK